MLALFYVLCDVRDLDGSNDCRIANHGGRAAIVGEPMPKARMPNRDGFIIRFADKI
jgi:hypothetical protein